MKPVKKSIGPRKQKIMDYVCSQGFAAPEELAHRHNVAPITVRRDLIWLENAGLLKRVHGGAVPSNAPLATTHADVRMRIASAQKRAIGAAAAALVQPGERLFLDAGSTCSFLAEALPNDMELTVITHSLDAIHKLMPKRGIHIITPGGELDERLNAFVGPVTEAAIAAFHVDKAFLGTAGIDLKAGFTDNSLFEERIKTLMSSHAKETFILADSSKFGRVAFRSILPLVRVSQVITNAGVPGRFRAAFRRKGIRIISAG
ncbi:MAG: DeoR/GlpR family DNA-binding transcription regulator [Verrucomicrobia bacterium]|nr:DeoR/GlpR family DNA-binding transcription regulator [Verrucomicrobiota bacterium]